MNLLLTRIQIELLRRFVPTEMGRVWAIDGSRIFLAYKPRYGTQPSRN